MSERVLNIPPSTLVEQYNSSDPTVSAWVSANAGSGKTHVLTQRVVRLMLNGSAPDRILCLTFTKAAAAEMKNRVFELLGKWTMLDDAALIKEIAKATGKKPDRRQMVRARELFALALDTPGGLKIQTIHAFCESLLHQFPLEANVPGNFETVQDAEKANLLALAHARVMNENPEAAQHYAALASLVSDDAIEKALNEVIANRQAFNQWSSGEPETAAFELYDALDLPKGVTAENLTAEAFENWPLSNEQIRQIVVAALEGTPATDIPVANAFQKLAESDYSRELLDQFYKLFWTDKGTIKKRLATDAVVKLCPGIVEWLTVSAKHIQQSLERIRKLELINISTHLFAIAQEVISTYGRMKRRRNMIDFEDQIERTAALLNRSEIRGWIRYRLDQGIDHVLVDEAQDTSPAQWEVINAVIDDFHAGENAARVNRTVFVVGDDKQSIFSFQGAEPSEFDIQRRALKKRVEATDQKFHPGALNLSFRSTPDVLAAVDKVFEHPEFGQGLTQTGTPPPHDAVRNAEPGEVLLWDMHVAEPQPKTESWFDPVDRIAKSDPAQELAERITHTIGEWIGKPLLGTGKPPTYGDILVLVRKRDKFIPALTRSMKMAGHKIAGADRLKLTSHIAVEDLLAIARFCLLPEDDLSLAAVLKCPLFGLDDKALYELAHARGTKTLLAQIQTNNDEKLIAIGSSLMRILSMGKTLNVFEFFGRLLGELGLRKIMLAQFGPEAEDVIDAFMDNALQYSADAKAGLEGFVAQFATDDSELKREVDQGRNEVRILTTHSAKGLEAKVVFLVDPGSPAWSEKHRPRVLDLDIFQNQPGPFLWVPTKNDQVSESQSITDQLKLEAEAEYRRLLYVGMTRAADRLIVCGYRSATEPKEPHWHLMVDTALRDSSQEILDGEGNIVARRWVKDEKPSVAPSLDVTPVHDADKPELPDWLFERISSEPPLPKPLTPSGAFALIDAEATVSDTPFLQPQDASSAMDRGNAVHRLLEVLPDLPKADHQKTVDQYISFAGKEWTPSDQEIVRNQVLSILDSPLFSELFTGNSNSEVTLAGCIQTAKGETLVSGQIDRLIISDNQVNIIDYKTNWHIPENPAQTPLEYLAQLALYKELIGRIHPDKQIHCALLWTRGPHLMPVPSGLMDEALEAINIK